MSTLPAIRPNEGIDLGSITADTALTITSSGRDYTVTPKDIILWVAPTAPLGDAKRHLVICQTLGLNPLLGEIDLLNLGGKWQTIIRKNGYLKCARNDPSYDGHESGIVAQRFDRAGATGKAVPIGELIDLPGQVLPDGYLLKGGWCKVYRKGISRPFYKRVSISEYMKDVKGGPWQQIPCTMIEKVAIAHAMREAIDLLAATYDDSELDRTPAPQVVEATVAKAQPRRITMKPARHVEDTTTVGSPERPPANPEQVAEIGRLVAAIGMTPHDYATMLDKRGVLDVAALDTFQAADIIGKLGTIVDREAWDPLATRPSACPVVDEGASGAAADAETSA